MPWFGCVLKKPHILRENYFRRCDLEAQIYANDERPVAGRSSLRKMAHA